MCAAPVVPSKVRTKQSKVPNTLVVVSDQDLSLNLACAVMKWLGCRIVHHADFNHRDDNDAKCVPMGLKIIIETLGKVATGPFGVGRWRKHVIDAANMLCADTNALGR